MFSKTLVRLCLLGVFGGVPALALGCSGDDITLSSQQAVNQFAQDYPACSTPGSLRIQEATPGDITNLNGLSGITGVLGNLQVFGNTHLENLSGLEGLTSVGGNLDLFENARLRNLDGLSNLSSVGGFLDVSFSDYLTDIDGLNQVTSVGTRLRLFHLYGLHDCKGIAPYIQTLGTAQRLSKVLVGTEGGLPRNGTGANHIAACLNSAAVAATPPALKGARPNVLFFLMDDVGLDQLGTFGYGGTVPPPTPALDQIAQAGVSFNNVWAMPECSPSRVAIFTGQLPVRSGTTGALGVNDLANSQLSPYTETLVDKLATAGYTSAMVGKWHLGGPENNAAELETPIQAGFDYYFGNVHGFLRSIDSTAGGVAPTGTYGCGFVPSTAVDSVNGADTGACYTDPKTCEVIAVGGAIDTPGRTCLERGGLFDPNTSCEETAPEHLDFHRENSYYVAKLESMSAPATPDAPVVVNEFMARGYRTTIEADEAIRWVNDQSGETPWFLTVSLSAVHTPLQQVPQRFSPAFDTPSSLDCTDLVDQRALQKSMLSVLSEEIGRVLTETGLMAPTGPGGALEPTAAADDTVIIIAGDNGTLATMVNLPFDPTRAKGTAFQTGVQVPLIVAGAGVGDVGVMRRQMLSLIDVHGLILDVAGVPLPTADAPFDPVSPLAVMERALQAAPRGRIAVNVAPNLQVGGGNNPPCVISGGCTTVPISKSVCEDNSGIWYGPGADGVTPTGTPIPETGFAQCWEVNEFLYGLGEPLFGVAPTIGFAAANETHKLVRTEWTDFDPGTGGPANYDTEELFVITDPNGDPLLDYASADLLTSPAANNPDVQLAYEELTGQLEAYLALDDFAPEDANQDGVVDALDVALAEATADEWGLSSRYDLNLDGVTDQTDIAQILTAIQNALGLPKVIPALPMLGLAALATGLGVIARRRR